jgi:hypothetical protein
MRSESGVGPQPESCSALLLMFWLDRCSCGKCPQFVRGDLRKRVAKAPMSCGQALSGQSMTWSLGV